MKKVFDNKIKIRRIALVPRDKLIKKKEETN